MSSDESNGALPLSIFYSESCAEPAKSYYYVPNDTGPWNSAGKSRPS